MIEVELPDGSIVQFPAGTSDEVMRKALAAFSKPAEKVIATTKDGGRVIEGANGLSFTSPGYSTSDPAQVAKIMEGATPSEVSTSGFDQQTIAQGPASARLSKFVQGAPFVGQAADEAIGAVFGDKSKQGVRALQSAMDREHPVQSAALQIGGGVAGGVGMAAAAAPTVMAAAPATLGGQVLAGGTAAAGAGAIEGAISGYGAGNDGNRMESAGKGALWGAGAGLVAGAAAPVIGKGVQWIAERLKGLDVSAISKTFGIDKKAAEILKADLEAMDFSAAQRNLATAGPDAMLADAGLPMREALDSAITGGGKAARIGVDAVSARAAAAGGRLSRTMDMVLGAPEGVKSAAKSIAARTAPIRQKAYEMAYQTPVDYSSGAGRKIEEVLQRIPARTLNAAISEANEAMQAVGARNKQIMAKILPDGSVSFQEMPNVMQLDEIKKALGAVASSEVDQFGRLTGAGQRANRLAGELKDAIGSAVPTYARAVKLGGDKLAEDRALDLGRKLFTAGTSREAVAETMKGASLEAQDAARRGIRSYIDDTLARVRRSIDDPSADTAETLRLLNTLSTRDARDKLAVVLGPAKAARLMQEIDAAGKQFGTRQAIATGSATGRREARRAAVDQVMEPGILGAAQKGKPALTAQALIQTLTRETPQSDLARKQAVLADVAKALTEKRGTEVQRALQVVQAAINGQPVKSADAAMIARLVATGGALAIDRTGTQLQSIQQNALAQR